MTLGATNVRAQVETGYRRLAHALATHAKDLIPDLTPLETGIGQLRVDERPDRYVWRLAVDQLTLQLVDLPKGTFPTGCRRPFAVRITNDLSVSVPKEPGAGAFMAPASLNTQVELEATYKVGVQRAAWHLDLHAYPIQEGFGALHPLVHWQHGGHAVTRWGISTVGEWMLTAAPRIAYPPLDVALSVCWALSNFAPAHWHYMCEIDTDFLALIRDHQRWLWQPYFQSIASHWTKTPDSNRHAWWPELIV